jgi:hypothetical protein
MRRQRDDLYATISEKRVTVDHERTGPALRKARKSGVDFLDLLFPFF